ncbi:MAG: MurR/RpiR family transcriptional regulator [Desulfobacterium sp.]|nr:MurR/RpiR family transcriptional regulator [Desulfobacterium sp.]
MEGQLKHPLMQRINDDLDSMTPKGRILADYILKAPRNVVFMTIRELASSSKVSESTIVRFVSQLGYGGYGAFIQALRDFLDTGMTLEDRLSLSSGTMGEGSGRLDRVIAEEIENLKRLATAIDPETVDRIATLLATREQVYVAGSRISYTFAYYLEWSLTKLRPGSQMLKGSDLSSIDRLTIAPEQSLVVIVTVSRYPNELIQLGKLARRLGHTLVVISDSSLCPINRFAHEVLIAPSRHFPIIGNPTTLSCLINHLVLEVAAQKGVDLKDHQQKLEQAYRENDLLFNLDDFRGYMGEE